MSDLLKPLIKEASVRSLKEGNKEITMVLRLILAEFQKEEISQGSDLNNNDCLLYTSPSPRDVSLSRMPSSA